MSNSISHGSLHESFGYKESASPNISPTGLPQPIYSYVKFALRAHTPIGIYICSCFFLRGGSSSEKLSNNSCLLRNTVQKYKFSAKNMCKKR